MKFRNEDTGEQLKEVLICGREACLLNDNAPNLSYCIDYDLELAGWVLGCYKLTFRVKNTASGIPFNRVQIWYSTSGPFDEDEHPTVTDPSAQSVVRTFYTRPCPPSVCPWTFVDVPGLEEGTQYWFAYRMLDGEGRSSQLYLMDKSYYTANCLPFPSIKEMMLVGDDDCRLNGLIWETDGILNGGSFTVVEQSGQATEPDAAYNKLTSIDAEESVTKYYYFIDTTDVSSATTEWLYWRWIWPGQDSTDWVEWEIRDTSQCGELVKGRLSMEAIRKGSGLCPLPFSFSPPEVPACRQTGIRDKFR